MQRPYESNRLKAAGNLSYLDFIRLLQKYWEEAHPDIPFLATGTRNDSTYPCIVYGLDLRRPIQNEPKPRIREIVPTYPDEDSLIIYGQRFQNVINFIVMSQSDPRQAEEIIEVFENFVIEFIPVFKQLGAAELVYVRRLPDFREEKVGLDITARAVSFMLTTEKNLKVSKAKLEEIIIDARLWLEKEQEIFTGNTADSTITLPGSGALSIGDIVRVSYASSGSLPDGLLPGLYVITNIIQNSSGRSYTLSKLYGAATPVPVILTSPGVGRLSLERGGITVNITDQNATPSYI